MLINDLTVDFSHSDSRGSLVQLVHSNCDQVNVLTSFKGTIRGNHYHKISTESFFVITGSVEVTCSLNEEKETRVFEAGQFFQIKPNINHSMFFPQDCILVAMYDVCVEKEDGIKDIYS